MELGHEDKAAIIEVVAARYFSSQKWNWINLKSDVGKIYAAFEELDKQYDEYPYMSRDWYVENSATKSVHMCEKWNELKELIEFLDAYVQHFDFMVKGSDQKSFCIASESKELTDEQKNAIHNARKSRCNTFVFTASVPDDVGFELSRVGGGM
ncbi:MAG TPA: hypothetical protein C5S50_05590 [Methanosarcinaceae archaeon]|nr:hypothetical protein [Methanosarcinaceae archaeon]